MWAKIQYNRQEKICYEKLKIEKKVNFLYKVLLSRKIILKIKKLKFIYLFFFIKF